MIVGLQDGPRITYTYKASNPAPKCKPFRASASTSASQACLEVAKFVVSAFHPGRVRAPTGRRVLNRWVLKGGNSVAQTVPFLTYYEGASEQDPGRTRGSVLRLKVTGADLRTSGVDEVAKLNFVVDACGSATRSSTSCSAAARAHAEASFSSTTTGARRGAPTDP